MYHYGAPSSSSSGSSSSNCPSSISSTSVSHMNNSSIFTRDLYELSSPVLVYAVAEMSSIYSGLSVLQTIIALLSTDMTNIRLLSLFCNVIRHQETIGMLATMSTQDTTIQEVIDAYRVMMRVLSVFTTTIYSVHDPQRHLLQMLLKGWKTLLQTLLTAEKKKLNTMMMSMTGLSDNKQENSEGSDMIVPVMGIGNTFGQWEDGEVVISLFHLFVKDDQIIQQLLLIVSLLCTTSNLTTSSSQSTMILHVASLWHYGLLQALFTVIGHYQMHGYMVKVMIITLNQFLDTVIIDEHHHHYHHQTNEVSNTNTTTSTHYSNEEHVILWSKLLIILLERNKNDLKLIHILWITIYHLLRLFNNIMRYSLYSIDIVKYLVNVITVSLESNNKHLPLVIQCMQVITVLCPPPLSTSNLTANSTTHSTIDDYFRLSFGQGYHGLDNLLIKHWDQLVTRSIRRIHDSYLKGLEAIGCAIIALIRDCTINCNLLINNGFNEKLLICLKDICLKETISMALTAAGSMSSTNANASNNSSVGASASATGSSGSNAADAIASNASVSAFMLAHSSSSMGVGGMAKEERRGRKPGNSSNSNYSDNASVSGASVSTMGVVGGGSSSSSSVGPIVSTVMQSSLRLMEICTEILLILTQYHCRKLHTTNTTTNITNTNASNTNTTTNTNTNNTTNNTTNTTTTTTTNSTNGLTSFVAQVDVTTTRDIESDEMKEPLVFERRPGIMAFTSSGVGALTSASIPVVDNAPSSNTVSASSSLGNLQAANANAGVGVAIQSRSGGNSGKGPSRSTTPIGTSNNMPLPPPWLPVSPFLSTSYGMDVILQVLDRRKTSLRLVEIVSELLVLKCYPSTTTTTITTGRDSNTSDNILEDDSIIECKEWLTNKPSYIIAGNVLFVSILLYHFVTLPCTNNTNNNTSYCMSLLSVVVPCIPSTCSNSNSNRTVLLHVLKLLYTTMSSSTPQVIYGYIIQIPLVLLPLKLRNCTDYHRIGLLDILFNLLVIYGCGYYDNNSDNSDRECNISLLICNQIIDLLLMIVDRMGPLTFNNHHNTRYSHVLSNTTTTTTTTIPTTSTSRGSKSTTTSTSNSSHNSSNSTSQYNNNNSHNNSTSNSNGIIINNKRRQYWTEAILSICSLHNNTNIPMIMSDKTLIDKIVQLCHIWGFGCSSHPNHGHNHNHPIPTTTTTSVIGMTSSYDDNNVISKIIRILHTTRQLLLVMPIVSSSSVNIDDESPSSSKIELGELILTEMTHWLTYSHICNNSSQISIITKELWNITSELFYYYSTDWDVNSKDGRCYIIVLLR